MNYKYSKKRSFKIQTGGGEVERLGTGGELGGGEDDVPGSPRQHSGSFKALRAWL